MPSSQKRAFVRPATGSAPKKKAMLPVHPAAYTGRTTQQTPQVQPDPPVQVYGYADTTQTGNANKTSHHDLYAQQAAYPSGCGCDPRKGRYCKTHNPSAKPCWYKTRPLFTPPRYYHLPVWITNQDLDIDFLKACCYFKERPSLQSAEALLMVVLYQRILVYLKDSCYLDESREAYGAPYHFINSLTHGRRDSDKLEKFKQVSDVLKVSLTIEEMDTDEGKFTHKWMRVGFDHLHNMTQHLIGDVSKRMAADQKLKDPAFLNDFEDACEKFEAKCDKASAERLDKLLQPWIHPPIDTAEPPTTLVTLVCHLIDGLIPKYQYRTLQRLSQALTQRPGLGYSFGTPSLDELSKQHPGLWVLYWAVQRELRYLQRR